VGRPWAEVLSEALRTYQPVVQRNGNGLHQKTFYQEFDLADACLMHLSDREAIPHVFTLDRRHFSVFRKNDGNALTLLPRAGV